MKKSPRVGIANSKKAFKLERRTGPVLRRVKRLTRAERMRRFRKTAVFQDIVARFPRAARAQNWFVIARFSASKKEGTARRLDIFDCDHLDGLSDIANFPHLAFFANKSPTIFDTKIGVGRVDCYFNAPEAGTLYEFVPYVSRHKNSKATVEYFIDNMSLGTFPSLVLVGLVATLSAGIHRFRIRQVGGPFFYHGLEVNGLLTT